MASIASSGGVRVPNPLLNRATLKSTPLHPKLRELKSVPSPVTPNTKLSTVSHSVTSQTFKARNPIATKKPIINPPEAEGTLVEGPVKREKRLERNRESARLSRRRRKHYLELLEERVTALCQEKDEGRRVHASGALSQIRTLREKIMTNKGGHFSVEERDRLLTEKYSRTCDEMDVLLLFWREQLKSLVAPCQDRFLMWLTLQNETFFRWGRAANERLSAARIGEKVLSEGKGRHVSPQEGMWPLFCNDVTLSYEQEERARTFQRTLLMDTNSWINIRHMSQSSLQVINAAHASLHACQEAVRQREKNTIRRILSPEQRVKFLEFANKHKSRLGRIITNLKRTSVNDTNTKINISPLYHQTANMYLLTQTLSNIQPNLTSNATSKATPTFPAVAVPPHYLKRFGIRPSFESLAAAEKLEPSYSSSGSLQSAGSLKRRSDSITSEFGDINSNAPAQQSIIPEVAQANAASFINETLRPASIQAPTLTASTLHALSSGQMQQHEHTQQHQPQPITCHYQPKPVLSSSPNKPKKNDTSTMELSYQPKYDLLNVVVPEESELPHHHVPNGTRVAEDFLFDLSKEDCIVTGGASPVNTSDWSIGGIDIEMLDGY